MTAPLAAITRNFDLNLGHKCHVTPPMLLCTGTVHVISLQVFLDKYTELSNTRFMTTNNETDLRQERGRLLSQNKGIKKIAGVTWLVPSQTQSSGGYVVNTAEATCTCPDYELRRCKC